MRRKQMTIPAFLEVLQNGKRAFVPSTEYLSNPDFRGQVVSRALAELGKWREKFGNILDLVAHTDGQVIVRQIDKLKEKLGRDWPTMPDDPLD